MKKVRFWWLITIIGLVLAGCAPKAAPAPGTPLAAPAPATPEAAPAPRAVSPEEAEWAKVVAAAKKEGKLTLYSGFLVGDVGTYIVKGFKDRTGLGLDVVGAMGSIAIERIKAERRAGVLIASMLDASAIDVYFMRQEGLTQPIGYLPSLADETVWQISPWLDPETYGLFMGQSLQTPYINTKLVKPGEEPKSWKDMLQPKWKGKIAFIDPELLPVVTRNYYYLTKYAGLDDSYFRALGKQVLFYPTGNHGAATVAQGNVAIAWAQGQTNMGAFALEGAPIKAIDMEEGAVATLANGVGLVKDAPHPNAARVYISWLFSQEGQTVYHKYRGTGSSRKDVPNFLPPAHPAYA